MSKAIVMRKEGGKKSIKLNVHPAEIIEALKLLNSLLINPKVRSYAR